MTHLRCPAARRPGLRCPAAPPTRVPRPALPGCPPARPGGLETGTKRRRPVWPRMADAMSPPSAVCPARFDSNFRDSGPDVADGRWFYVNRRPSAILGQTGRPMFETFEKHRLASNRRPMEPTAACQAVFRMLRTSVGHSGPDWPADWGEHSPPDRRPYRLFSPVAADIFDLVAGGRPTLACVTCTRQTRVASGRLTKHTPHESPAADTSRQRQTRVASGRHESPAADTSRQRPTHPCLCHLHAADTSRQRPQVATDSCASLEGVKACMIARHTRRHTRGRKSARIRQRPTSLTSGMRHGGMVSPKPDMAQQTPLNSMMSDVARGRHEEGEEPPMAGIC